MSIVDHRKCKECHKINELSKFKENPDGVGMVCLDDVACKKRQSKNTTISHPWSGQSKKAVN